MITMKDIAAAAGVSRPTVSVVLNGKKTTVRVSDAVRQRILDTAREMGYRRNELARAVKSGRSGMIAFIGGSRTSYALDIIAGVNETLRQKGFVLKLFMPRRDEKICGMIRQCVEQMAEGVICRALSEEQLETARRELEPRNIPLTLVDNSFEHDWCSRVVSDDITGGRMAAEHLLSLGHRRIGLLSVSGNRGYSAPRANGHKAALAAAGIEPDPNLELKIPQTEDFDSGQRRAIEEYLKKIRPTAVFCVSDPLAMKLLMTAHALGMRVPGDISAVGYANLNYANYSSPPLTTIEQPFAEMGRAAADITIQSLGEKNFSPVNKLLPVRLVIRESTAPPGHKKGG